MRDRDAAGSRPEERPPGRRVVVALDSFKGSIAAAPACASFADGWKEVDPTVEVVLRPMADGGEGTLEAFAAAVPDARRMPVTVRGPEGVDHVACWLLLPDGTGVVELASTSGIELLGARRRPWDADTFGFGQAIAAALDHGVRRLVLGIGSSASTDAGLGLLQALGAVVADASGDAVAPGARGLRAVASVDLGSVRRLPPDGAIVLTDVTHHLTGPRGAAAAFGPQKGLLPGDIAEVDAALAAVAHLLPADPDRSGAGAAGGAGFALAAWGASLRSGADAVADLVGLDAAIAAADAVVTGEGSFDVSSTAGKAPAHVAARASQAGVPVALVAGRVADGADTTAFSHVVSLSDLAGSVDRATAEPARWLRAAGRALAARLA